MANIKRCDNCKKVSDAEDASEKVFEVGDLHTIKFKLTTTPGRFTMQYLRVSHPNVDLCASCLIRVIADGSIISAGEKSGIFEQ